jgi:hypothetical protein
MPSVSSARPLESQFHDIANRHPELLAHHCTEAGLIEMPKLVCVGPGAAALSASASDAALYGAGARQVQGFLAGLHCVSFCRYHALSLADKDCP